jgi:hypothetical protein
MRMEIPEVKKCPEQSSVGGIGYSKLRLLFSAERLRISALRTPARWLYPLKPGGEQKSADVRQKTVALIYPDPVETNPSNICIFSMDIHFLASWYYANSFCIC